MKRTLRILVLTEIALTISSLVVDFYMQQFLPDLLQAYLRQTKAVEITSLEWTVLAISLGIIALMIVAWIALWRFSRHARLLYTCAWAVSLPLTIMWGPYVRSGTAEALEVAAVLTAGMILGILYFDVTASAGKPSNKSAAVGQQQNR
jgi:cellobiose-specific phosphotransferase system component IIC